MPALKASEVSPSPTPFFLQYSRSLSRERSGSSEPAWLVSRAPAGDGIGGSSLTAPKRLTRAACGGAREALTPRPTPQN